MKVETVDRDHQSQERKIKGAVSLFVVTLVLIPLPDMLPNSIGNLKVDVFLFNDVEEKIKWILFDSIFLLQLVSCMYIIKKFAIMYSNQIYHVTNLLFKLAVIRIIEYFTFFGKIPVYPIVTGLCMYCLYKLYYGSKNINA